MTVVQSIWYWFESAPRRLQLFTKSTLPGRVRALSVPDTLLLVRFRTDAVAGRSKRR